MSAWFKILNVGRDICSPLIGQNCFKIINVGRNICSPESTNCIKINNVRKPEEQTTWDVGIQITVANQTFGIVINGVNPNITIDWGEGTTQTYTTIGLKTQVYNTAGNYTVKINGSFSDNGNIRFPIIGNNNEFISNANLLSTSVIPYIPGLTNFDFCFNNTQNRFTTIPSNLFINNPQATSFIGCFRNAINLTSIPENLFANNPGVTSFLECFTSCLSLTTIPENLFANNPEVINFGGCFSNCENLTSIPENLFANNFNATNFTTCFADCFALTTVPSTLFANNINANSFNLCFASVSLTTTSYSNLLINMASNAASRPNNVLFGGGNSRYNLDGQIAKQTLETKGWTFTDLGLAS